jgi:signal recognition particle receptor subunit beta
VVFFNYTTMQLTAKIVYYGPGLCGKTTNLQYIHKKTAARSRGEMVSLETETDRTLFFDLLPLDVGVIGGMKVRLQLYTVPGQVFYNATRKLVLKSVDGMVFVADSQAVMEDANLESISNLKVNLAEMGLTLDQVPLVFQFNKRDLRNILPLEVMNETLNPEGRPYFEAAALHGLGVFETLKGIARLSIASVRDKVGPDAIWPKAPAIAIDGAGDEPALEMPVLDITPPRGLNPDALAPTATPEPAVTPDRVGTSPQSEAVESDAAIRLEFAEEGGGEKAVRAVKTKGALDIQAELAKLRAMTSSPKPPAPPSESPGRNAIEKRLQDMIGTHGARQDIKRKASIDVPDGLLQGSGTLRVHLAFEGPGPEEIVRDAVVIRLGPNQKLERLTLHLDLEVRARPPENG